MIQATPPATILVPIIVGRSVSRPGESQPRGYYLFRQKGGHDSDARDSPDLAQLTLHEAGAVWATP